jgi:hypothetical protein
MSKQLIWRCPLCTDCKIVRGGEAYLELAVGEHIKQHEEKAALIAVDKARIQCKSTSCEIGRASHWNKTIGNSELLLTDFDVRLLQGMKIKGEE